MYRSIDRSRAELWREREARRDASGANDGDGDRDDASERAGRAMTMGKHDFIRRATRDASIETRGDGLKLPESSRERRTERNRIESNRIESNRIESTPSESSTIQNRDQSNPEIDPVAPVDGGRSPGR